MNLKKINIIYGGILVSMLIAEMSLVDVLNFNVIRFLQILIFLNLFSKGFKSFDKTIIFFFVPAIIYIIHSVFYSFSEIVVGDFFNLTWWFIFMLIMNNSLRDIHDFEKFKSILFNSTFFFTTIASFLGLLKLYYMSAGTVLSFFVINLKDGSKEVSFGSSLNIDYNIYAVSLYCGTFAGLYCYKKAITVKLKIAYSVALLVILTAGLLSGSRRGFVIGIFLLLYVIFWSFRTESANKIEVQFRKKIKTNLYEKPWIAIVFLLVFFVALTKVDLTSVIESSSQITSVFDRLLTLEDISSQENGTRIDRWEYAFVLFSETPVFSKLFGDGFDYLKTFGYKFDVGDSDYPHNVWISSLLYGGVIGFLSTLFLTFYVFFFLYKRRYVFREFFVWYVLFILINFTSSNTIYSTRIFVVLLLLPFLSFCHTRKVIN